MGTIQARIDAFNKLGSFLSQFSTIDYEKKENIPYNDLFFDGFKHQLMLAKENNQWFTKDNLAFACKSWAEALSKNNIHQWITNENILNVPSDKVVAIIMAGNIPLVGFHDFLSVLISGNSVLVKKSSKDKHLLPFLAQYLIYVENSFKGKIKFTDEKLTNFDAVIATGSDNTARYFEYYFRNRPAIIRKNRNSVAVLTGNETDSDFLGLSEDVFRYFGLGCRSVSKIFVPKNYNFDNFFQGMYHQHKIINNLKYANNYDYNKTVYLMSEFDILENGFLMVKEDSNYSSPIATVFYEYYDDIDNLKIKLYEDRQRIQCIVANNFLKDEVAFGETQNPKLWDYADGVNTLEFLSQI